MTEQDEITGRNDRYIRNIRSIIRGYATTDWFTTTAYQDDLHIERMPGIDFPGRHEIRTTWGRYPISSIRRWERYPISSIRSWLTPYQDPSSRRMEIERQTLRNHMREAAEQDQPMGRPQLGHFAGIIEHVGPPMTLVLDQDPQLEADSSELLDAERVRTYHSLIGALQWAVSLGRLDIATAVMTLSSFYLAPRQGHLERLEQIFEYLTQTSMRQ